MCAAPVELPRCSQCCARFPLLIRKVDGATIKYYATCIPCREKQKIRNQSYKAKMLRNEIDNTRNSAISSVMNCQSLHLLRRVIETLVTDPHFQPPAQPVLAAPAAAPQV